MDLDLWEFWKGKIRIIIDLYGIIRVTFMCAWGRGVDVVNTYFMNRQTPFN